MANGFRINRLEGELGRAGTVVKQIDILAAGRWRRLALAAGLYGVEYALAAWDRRINDETFDSLDAGRKEILHALPVFLPDGQRG